MSKLKGAVSPEELLQIKPASEDCGAFLECDPRDGFSVRNFQIQACKMAMVSDIIVYGDEQTDPSDTIALAKRISKAQRAYEVKNGFQRGLFNTFMLSGQCACGKVWVNEKLTVAEPFNQIEKNHPDLIAVDSSGCLTGKVTDFCE